MVLYSDLPDPAMQLLYPLHFSHSTSTEESQTHSLHLLPVHNHPGTLFPYPHTDFHYPVSVFHSALLSPIPPLPVSAWETVKVTTADTVLFLWFASSFSLPCVMDLQKMSVLYLIDSVKVQNTFP